jgi:hypothetical protein
VASPAGGPVETRHGSLGDGGRSPSGVDPEQARELAKALALPWRRRRRRRWRRRGPLPGPLTITAATVDEDLAARAPAGRKTGADLAASIKDRRLFEQIGRFREAYASVVLVVEGEPIHIAHGSWKGALGRALTTHAPGAAHGRPRRDRGLVDAAPRHRITARSRSRE